uniref:ELMO domain-containing protein n=1 Tax=Plectus sambesii TaxID=2011161 RepID=A0A914WJA0_9BILA
MFNWDSVRRFAETVYIYVVRATFKWVLHVLTGRSEVERLLEAAVKSKNRATTVYGIENALLLSKSLALRQLPDSCPPEHVGSAVQLIVKSKAIDFGKRPSVSRPLALVVEQIVGYRRLIQLVEAARREKYDSIDGTHEAKLFQLWALLKPGVSLEKRITKQWQEIGFQGNDPATDFRGMGLLGLEQLVYLAHFEKAEAQMMLSLSHHPKLGFPFAIAGITMTSLSRELLNTGLLKNHFYNAVLGVPVLVDFHRVYCRIFSLFCAAWKRADPASVMEFNVVKEQFHQNLIAYLRKDNAKLDSACNISLIYDVST